ncbi:MAG: Lrp/AsnC family transcriptional regulator [Chloroflexi bacterium]|nr:Lrp/AsnC family transcriptional regulator [Chloroflexota bacterium]
MLEKTFTVFLFLEVRSRKSGGVVDSLSEAFREVKEAAAVYSETDVIARVSGTKNRLGEILLELMQDKIPVYDPAHNINDIFEVNSVRPFLVEGILSWGPNEHSADLLRNIYAYAVIDVDEKQSTRAKVLQDLRECDGVIYTAGLTKRAKVIAKVRAPDKRAFDNRIMDQIQKIQGVATTRSLLVINDMHFGHCSILVLPHSVDERTRWEREKQS